MDMAESGDAVIIPSGAIRPFDPARWDGNRFREAEGMREARLAYQRDLCLGKSHRCLLLEPELSLVVVPDGEPDPEPCIVLGPEPPDFPLLYPQGGTEMFRESADCVGAANSSDCEAKRGLLRKLVPASLMQILADLGMEYGHPEMAVLAAHFPEFAQIVETDPQLALLYALHHYTGRPGSRSFAETGEQVRDGAAALAHALDFPWKRRHRKLLHHLCLFSLPDRSPLRRVLHLPAAATYLTAANEALPAGVIEAVATWKRLPKRSVRKPVGTLKMEVQERG